VDTVRDHEHHFYWDAARAGRLEIVRCQACGTWIHYPQPRCPGCLGTDVVPTRVSGRGTVASFTVTHFAPTPALADSLPITLVMVELDDAPGVRIVTNLVDGPDQARIGLPVEVTFEERGGETVPQFRPA
jgi:uncharacterized OB-fold protein